MIHEVYMIQRFFSDTTYITCYVRRPVVPYSIVSSRQKRVEEFQLDHYYQIIEQCYQVCVQCLTYIRHFIGA